MLPALRHVSRPRLAGCIVALGRRIEKNVAGSITRFYYDGWREIEEQDVIAQILATYVYGLHIDEVLNMRRGLPPAVQDYFYHTDALYNVAAVTDATGIATERYQYEDYGKPRFFTGSGNPIAQSAISN